LSWVGIGLSFTEPDTGSSLGLAFARTALDVGLHALDLIQTAINWPMVKKCS